MICSFSLKSLIYISALAHLIRLERKEKHSFMLIVEIEPFIFQVSNSMDTELNSPPHDDGDTSAAFRKPSNDGASRKYRRRALADDGSSSSDG